MKGAKLFAIAVICLWLAAGCQPSLAPRLSLAGAGPDFFLITVAGLGLYCNRRGGAFLGFSAGMLQGAVVGADLSGYVLTRTIVGFACGSLKALELEPSPLVAAAVTALATLAAQLGLIFVAPQRPILHFVLATIGSAMVNGALAMPFHLVIRRFSDPYSR